jgi:hypothetical protein
MSPAYSPGSAGEMSKDHSVSDEVSAAFQQAISACPHQLVQRTYAFAGHRVLMCVVGHELAARTHLPFVHLAEPESSGSAPELQIDLWDESVTGVAPPPSLVAEGRPGARMAYAGQISYAEDGMSVRYLRPDSATWLDRAAARIVGWRANGARLWAFERTHPLPIVLPLWYRDHHVQVVHAGLVARGNTGALLAGKGGAGKSTTALACFLGGLDCLGDDQVGMQIMADGTVFGHSLFSVARLDTSHLAHFPAALPYALPPESDTDSDSLLPLGHIASAQLPRQVPIRAVLLPRVVDRELCSIVPASKAEALRAIALSSLQMSANPDQDDMKRLVTLVEHRPGFWLELGRDLRSIAVTVEELLHHLGSQEGHPPCTPPAP